MFAVRRGQERPTSFPGCLILHVPSPWGSKRRDPGNKVEERLVKEQDGCLAMVAKDVANLIYIITV